MSQKPTLGGYGVDYGKGYGAESIVDETVTSGWGVVLETTDGAKAFYTDPILDVSVEPEHTGMWDAQFKVAPIIDHRRFRNGRYRLISAHDDTPDVRGLIEDDTEAADGTITLGGRRRVGMALRNSDTSVAYRDRLGSAAIRDAWAQLGFDATVYDAPRQPVYGEIAQRARVPADFRNIYEFYERNELGQSEGASGGGREMMADEWDTTIRSDQPIALTEGGVSLLPVASVIEGETGKFASPTSIGRGNGPQQRASQDTVATYDGIDAGDAYHFESEYDWGESAKVAFRYRRPNGDGQPMYALLTRGHGGFASGKPQDYRWSSLGRLPDTDRFEWFFFEPFENELPEGKYTLSLYSPALAPPDIDVVAVYDSEYESQLGFDHAFEGGVLRRPREYVTQHLNSRVASTGMVVEEARCRIRFKHRPPPSNRIVTIRAPATDGEGYGAGISRSVTGSLSLADASTTSRLQTRIKLEPRTNTSPGAPYDADGGQTLESFELEADGNAVPLFTDYQNTGSGFDVLQDMHDRCGFHFQLYDDGDSGGEPQYRAESFRRGDPKARRPQPDGLRTLSVEEAASTADYANQVTVVGSEREFGSGRYRATVRDESEIGDKGVIPLDVDDPKANSMNDAWNRARMILQDSLNADEESAKIATTPAIVEPGYPYRMGWLEGDAVFDVWGENSWGEGRWGGSVYRTLETSSYQTGSSSSLDFARRGGVGGDDLGQILQLLAG